MARDPAGEHDRQSPRVRQREEHRGLRRDAGPSLGSRVVAGGDVGQRVVDPAHVRIPVELRCRGTTPGRGQTRQPAWVVEQAVHGSRHLVDRVHDHRAALRAETDAEHVRRQRHRYTAGGTSLARDPAVALQSRRPQQDARSGETTEHLGVVDFVDGVDRGAQTFSYRLGEGRPPVGP